MRRTYTEWTEDDEKRLKEFVRQRASAFRAAIALKRSTSAVQRKARELGLSLPATRRKFGA
jgi:hypothetical protein